MTEFISCVRSVLICVVGSFAIVPVIADEPVAKEFPQRKLSTDEERTLRKLEHQMSSKFKLERDLETLARMSELDEKQLKYREQVTMLLQHVEAAIAQLDPDGSLREKLPPSREFERLFDAHHRLLKEQRFHASPAGLKDKRLGEKLEQLEKAITKSDKDLLKHDPTGRWRKILEAKPRDENIKPPSALPPRE